MSRMFNLKELLEGKQSVALGGHVRPDGDCVGSTMGLYLYLKENFPQIETDLYLESVPEAYSMIRHTDEVKSELPEGKIYDLFICMDCGDLQRLGFRCKTIRQILRQRDRITRRLGKLAQSLRAEDPVGGGAQRLGKLAAVPVKPDLLVAQELFAFHVLLCLRLGDGLGKADLCLVQFALVQQGVQTGKGFLYLHGRSPFFG